MFININNSNNTSKFIISANNFPSPCQNVTDDFVKLNIWEECQGLFLKQTNLNMLDNKIQKISKVFLLISIQSTNTIFSPTVDKEEFLCGLISLNYPDMNLVLIDCNLHYSYALCRNKEDMLNITNSPNGCSGNGYKLGTPKCQAEMDLIRSELKRFNTTTVFTGLVFNQRTEEFMIVQEAINKDQENPPKFIIIFIIGLIGLFGIMLIVFLIFFLTKKMPYLKKINNIQYKEADTRYEPKNNISFTTITTKRGLKNLTKTISQIGSTKKLTLEENNNKQNDSFGFIPNIQVDDVQIASLNNSGRYPPGNIGTPKQLEVFSLEYSRLDASPRAINVDKSSTILQTHEQGKSS